MSIIRTVSRARGLFRVNIPGVPQTDAVASGAATASDEGVPLTRMLRSHPLPMGEGS